MGSKSFGSIVFSMGMSTAFFLSFGFGFGFGFGLGGVNSVLSVILALYEPLTLEISGESLILS